MSSHLRQSVEYIVEKEKYLSLGHLGDVVHALASVISNPRILIGEASEDGWYDFSQIGCHSFLDPYISLVRPISF